MQPLIYCGQISDLDLIHNNELTIFFFDCNKYTKHYYPATEIVKADEILVAGNIYYSNLLMIAEKLLSIHPKVCGCFIEPEPFESVLRHTFADRFILDHMGPTESGMKEFSRLRIISKTRDGIIDKVSLADYNKYRYTQLFYYLNNYSDISKGLKPSKLPSQYSSFK